MQEETGRTDTSLEDVLNRRKRMMTKKNCVPKNSSIILTMTRDNKGHLINTLA